MFQRISIEDKLRLKMFGVKKSNQGQNKNFNDFMKAKRLKEKLNRS